jgi:hypothetical protein
LAEKSSLAVLVLSDRENLIAFFQLVIVFQLAERVGVWGRGNDRFPVCD